MDFWDHLFPGRKASGQVQIGAELMGRLGTLAEAQRCSTNELVADLLRAALAQRLADEAHLQRWRSLSPREQEVTALTCLGNSNQEIASHLTISSETVKTHLRNVQHKFGMRSKSELCQALAHWDFSAWEDPSPEKGHPLSG